MNATISTETRIGGYLHPVVGRFVLIEVGDGCYHGVRDNVTIYRIWPYPGEKTWGASYHSSNRFVAKANSLKEMHAILEARCCNPPNAELCHRSEPVATLKPKQG